MFSAKNLEDRLTSLYRYGVHEAGYAESDVDAMLHALDFPALARAIRHNAETVYACTLDTTVPNIPLSWTGTVRNAGGAAPDNTG